MTAPQRPQFITFTGADEYTDVAAMLALSSRYPIEWGILLSPKRQGSGRYPPAATVMKLQAYAPALKLSAHLCGQYAADLIRAGALPIYRQPLNPQSFIRKCQRVQVNSGLPLDELNVGEVSEWAASIGVRVIYQTRTWFPEDDRVDWLFDVSGGRGIAPGEWIRPPIGSKAIHGYAGGLNPDNIARNIEMIEWEAGANYWVDMETGVRDENDRFSLDKCRAVCEAVYGERA